MLKDQPPGTSDTSRMATGNINNPNYHQSDFYARGEDGMRARRGEKLWSNAAFAVD